jgi:CDP-glucose 4,6-dehydratase
MNAEFWRGKRVFLTGHTGFKGSWLALWLQQLGADVTGYALPPPTKPSLFEMAGVAQGMQSNIGDVRDLPSLQSALAASRAEIVLHLAAQPLVRYSYENPVETYSTNVMGTVHLLEAVRQAGGVKAVVNVTTDKCYENREWDWGYRENEPMGGYDPYSNSKGCSELVTAAYRSSYFNPVDHARHGLAIASARAGNVIGGGDWAANRLLPDIVSAFTHSVPVQIQNTASIRPWQHVLEPLRAYLMLAENLYRVGPRFAEAWNFGPEDVDCKPVGWIAGEMTRLWGGSASWNHIKGDFPHEANFLKLDISKARIHLGWQPSLHLQDALRLTTEWAKAQIAGDNPRDITLGQIRQYQNQTAAQKAMQT